MCEICGRVGRTVADHDHATGFVRGRLCIRCNMALAFVEEPLLLDKALAYLARPQSDMEYRMVQLASMKRRYAEDPAYREAAKARAKQWNRDNNYKHQRAAKQRLKAI
jgi:hypothetical protein